MKKSKFTQAQIAFFMKQADEGTAVAEVCRKAGISEATFYSWRKGYGGMMRSEVRKLHQIKEENEKLKRLVADLSLDKAMLKRCFQKSSEACSPTPVGGRGSSVLEGFDQTGLFIPEGRTLAHHHKSRRGDQADLKTRIKEITLTRVRYGYPLAGR